MSGRLLRSSISAAFLLSGMAGLIYEVVWSKYLTLFIGGTALAHTIVLATFMGGLACGNAIFGRLADRPGARCLQLYAFLEIGIGLFCLLFPALFARLGAAYLSLGAWTGPTSAVNPFLKALLAVGSLFVPCMLMGGTLPLLTKYITDSLSGLGMRLGWLYFVNTAGAVFGCLLAGFYLIEAWGLEFAMVATSLVNFAIGAAFYVISRGASAAPAPEGEAASDAAAEVEYTPRQARVAFWCISLAGALTMLYEIVWFRLLVLSIGGTVHAFSTMLAGFVAGIAAGAAVAAGLLRRHRSALALLGLCELLIGLCTLVPFALYERLPYAFFRVGASLVHSPANYGLYMSIVVLFAMLLMGIPALLMGAALPLASRVCVARLERLGRGVGNVFSANTLGNVVGAVLVGLVLLPALGLERTLLWGAVASGALGVVILWAWRGNGADRWLRALGEALGPRPSAIGARLWPGALLLVAGFAVWRLWAGPLWDARILQAGLFRWEAASTVPPTWSGLRVERARAKALYSRDGADASLLVEEWPSTGKELARAVRVNGKPDASTAGDMPTQIFVGHLAAFFHPAPREAMVVGLGSGATAAAVLRHPGLHADVAEISPEMVDAARYFEGVNDNVLANPRLSLSVIDAREFLLLSRRRYDVIVSEPTNIWIPGVSTLFTRDFYGVVRSRLNPGGVFTQWLQGYTINESVIASTVASLREAFPYVSLWVVRDQDLVFLASDRRPSLDPADFARRFAEVRPAEGLASVEPGLTMLADPVAFLMNQIASDEAVALFWPRGEALPYADLFPRMEFAAARMQFQARGLTVTDELDERKWPVGREPLFLQEYLRQAPLDAAAAGGLARRLMGLAPSLQRLGEAMALAPPLPATPDVSLLPERVAGEWLLARELEVAVRAERSLPRCDAYLRVAHRLFSAASTVVSRTSSEPLEREVDACAAAHPQKAVEWKSRLVVALALSHATERALVRLQQFEAEGLASRLHPHDQAVFHVQAARVLVRLGRRPEAEARLLEALRVEPTNARAAQAAFALKASAATP